MVEIASLITEGKLTRIKETELGRYLQFFSASHQDNLGHAKGTAHTHPRWSIISGYYAMHDITKLLIAKLYRLKVEQPVHTTTIKALKAIIKDKETLQRLETGYDTFRALAEDLADAKKERVKVQYYTGTAFLKKKYERRAQEFLATTVEPYIKSINEVLERTP